jgi:hypothetical protein
MCGFDVLQGSRAVPSRDACTHFLRNLLKRADRIEAMSGELLRRLSEVLPDLGATGPSTARSGTRQQRNAATRRRPSCVRSTEPDRMVVGIWTRSTSCLWPTK